MYGGITKEYTVWCADNESDDAPCEHESNLQLSDPTKSDFIRDIREVGWRLISGVWYCPACVRRQKKGSHSS